jgi:hypothetical protein
MTNQNPAVPQPKSPKLDRDILAKVNAHADRSLDRLFTDIEDLLSGDLEADGRNSRDRRYAAESSRSHQSHQQPEPSSQSQHPTYPPQSDFVQPQLSAQVEPPQTATPKPKKRSIPMWMKALLGIGITSIAAGSVLLWLVNERKVVLPKNIDTTWLPFQSQSQISPEDAKFADYMRKSISKIESANLQATSASNSTIPVNATPANPIDSANSTTTTTTQSAPIATTPTGVIATVPSAIVAKAPIALLKTFQTGNRPSAIFEIDRQNQTVHIGQKIGTSNWSLLTVANGEVIVKRKGGEIRSIFVGQKF